jgi:type 1 fimbriae regulatory protein FimB
MSILEEVMSPRIKPLRTRRWKATDQQGVTPEELQAMIKVSKDDRHAGRNECMLLVGFSFGLRVSELLGLRVRDVDIKDERIHIEAAKSGKTQDIEISKAVVRKLKAYMKDAALKSEDFLFPGQWKGEAKPMSRGYFHVWFQRTAEAAGLPIAKQHPHALRHGLGSTKAAAGETPLQIAAALRHRSARMALQFYGQVSDEAVAKASRATLSKYPWL